MPKLACRTCGRQVDTATSEASRVVAEGRCPRCGETLHPERRHGERRVADRRMSRD